MNLIQIHCPDCFGYSDGCISCKGLGYIFIDEYCDSKIVEVSIQKVIDGFCSDAETCKLENSLEQNKFYNLKHSICRTDHISTNLDTIDDPLTGSLLIYSNSSYIDKYIRLSSRIKPPVDVDGAFDVFYHTPNIKILSNGQYSQTRYNIEEPFLTIDQALCFSKIKDTGGFIQLKSRCDNVVYNDNKYCKGQLIHFNIAPDKFNNKLISPVCFSFINSSKSIYIPILSDLLIELITVKDAKTDIKNLAKSYYSVIDYTIADYYSNTSLIEVAIYLLKCKSLPLKTEVLSVFHNDRHLFVHLVPTTTLLNNLSHKSVNVDIFNFTNQPKFIHCANIDRVCLRSSIDQFVNSKLDIKSNLIELIGLAKNTINIQILENFNWLSVKCENGLLMLEHFD